MCERCNANDGRRTKTYKIKKGEAVVTRDLCDDCARLTNQIYPVSGAPAAPKPAPVPEAEPVAEPEAAPESSMAEGEEAGDGDAPAEEPEPETGSPRRRS